MDGFAAEGKQQLGNLPALNFVTAFFSKMYIFERELYLGYEYKQKYPRPHPLPLKLVE